MAKDQASSQTQPVDQRAAETVGGRQVSTAAASGTGAGTTGTSGNTQQDFESIQNAATNAGRTASVSGNRITISGSDKITGYSVTLEPAPAQGGYRVVEVKGPDGRDAQRVAMFERDGVIPLETLVSELRREERETRDRKRAEEEQKANQEKAAREEQLRRDTTQAQPSGSSEAATPNPPDGEEARSSRR